MRPHCLLYIIIYLLGVLYSVYHPTKRSVIVQPVCVIKKLQVDLLSNSSCCCCSLFCPLRNAKVVRSRIDAKGKNRSSAKADLVGSFEALEVAFGGLRSTNFLNQMVVGFL